MFEFTRGCFKILKQSFRGPKRKFWDSKQAFREPQRPFRVSSECFRSETGVLGFRIHFVVMGAETNMAARLMGKAKVGSALVSERVYNSTKEYIGYDMTDPIEVKAVVCSFDPFTYISKIKSSISPLQHDRGLSHVTISSRVVITTSVKSVVPIFAFNHGFESFVEQ